MKKDRKIAKKNVNLPNMRVRVQSATTSNWVCVRTLIWTCEVRACDPKKGRISHLGYNICSFQEVSRQSSGSNQAVIRQSFGSCQAVINCRNCVELVCTAFDTESLSVLFSIFCNAMCRSILSPFCFKITIEICMYHLFQVCILCFKFLK